MSFYSFSGLDYFVWCGKVIGYWPWYWSGSVAAWQRDLSDMTFRYFYLRYTLTLIIVIRELCNFNVFLSLTRLVLTLNNRYSGQTTYGTVDTLYKHLYIIIILL